LAADTYLVDLFRLDLEQALYLCTRIIHDRLRLECIREHLVIAETAFVDDHGGFFYDRI
jgi:hypothetical protein